MIKIHKDIFIDNGFIGNSESTCLLKLLKEVDSDIFNNIQLLHGLVKYGDWTQCTDIFQYMKTRFLRKIQKRKAYFVFDYGTEGFSPVNEFPFFDMLYFNCKKYNISPRQIIYVSANHRDEENISKYTKNYNCVPIRVFSFPSFQKVVSIDDGLGFKNDIAQLQDSVELCNKRHTTKYLSSLSRVNRKYRSLASYLLWSSNIRDKALISHDIVNKEYISDILIENGYPIDHNSINDWLDHLPLTVDQTNFELNWALSQFPYEDIHAQTIFQIVNETQVSDRSCTTMFYSEKTFRPMGWFQPFVIYGQPGINHYLEKLGYKLYDEWFDLSFDFETDHVKRYLLLLEEVTRVSEYLDRLSKKERIQWRFKNKEILLHNFNLMKTSANSVEKMCKFLKTLLPRSGI